VNKDFEQFQDRIMSELKKIAFSKSEKVTVSQRLTALRLLAKYTGMDKGVKPEQTELPVFIDDIADPRLGEMFDVKKLNG